jgi:hypothetical protein
MGIKTYRPYTETRRFQTGLTFEEITTSTPHKPLLERLHPRLAVSWLLRSRESTGDVWDDVVPLLRNVFNR